MTSNQVQRKVTLFWIHGGAYVLGSGTMGLTSKLRLAEILASKGVQVDIFSLEYSLAPEATFPTQQQEAVAAYRYLIEDEKIDPRDIVVAGESAGGHLALLFLLSLQRSYQGVLPKPGAALLAYPWVNLLNTGASFERNQHKCMLQRSGLEQGVDAVTGGQTGRKRWANLLDFAALQNWDAFTWKDVLPNRTWVGVGSHDLFVDDIQAFCGNALNEGALIKMDVVAGQAHGWDGLADKRSEKEYCALGPEEVVPTECMIGAQSLAQGLVGIIGMDE